MCYNECVKRGTSTAKVAKDRGNRHEAQPSTATYDGVPIAVKSRERGANVGGDSNKAEKWTSSGDNQNSREYFEKTS